MRHQQLQLPGFFRTSRAQVLVRHCFDGGGGSSRKGQQSPAWNDTLKSGLIAPWDPRNHRISQDLTGEGTSSWSMICTNFPSGPSTKLAPHQDLKISPGHDAWSLGTVPHRSPSHQAAALGSNGPPGAAAPWDLGNSPRPFWSCTSPFWRTNSRVRPCQKCGSCLRCCNWEGFH